MRLVLNMPDEYVVSESRRDDSSSATSTIESLLPIQLDRDDYRDYVTSFFPRSASRQRSRAKKAFNVPEGQEEGEGEEGQEVEPQGSGKEVLPALKTFPEHYYEMVSYIAQVSGFVAAVKDHLKSLAIDSALYDDQALARSAPVRFSKSVAVATDRGVNQNLIADYVSGVQGKHIIRQVKGGLDVLFVGIPGAAPGTGTCLANPVSNRSPFPEGKQSTEYETMVAQGTVDHAAYRMARAVFNFMLKELTGAEATLGNASSRQYHEIPLDYDFSALLKRMNTLAGKYIPGIDLFGEYQAPRATTGMVNGIGKYMKLLFVREADRTLVQFISRNETPLSDDNSPLNKDALVFNADIGVSFKMFITDKIAHYITQTPAGKAVPLVPMSTWVSIWTSASIKNPSKKKKGGVKFEDAPRYVLSASQSSILAKRREELGFYSEPGRCNDDGIFISGTGRLHWCPPAKDLAIENAKNYEALMEQALRLSYDAGTPLNASQKGETHRVFGNASKEYREKIRFLKQQIQDYSGTLQTFSWDYNVILTSGITDPEKLVAYSLAGTTIPNDLSLADYLRKPFAKCMNILFPSTWALKEDGTRDGPSTESTFGEGGHAAPMLQTTLFANATRMYAYLLADKKMPMLQDLINEAAKELGLKTTRDHDYENRLYSKIMDENLVLRPEFNKIGTDEELLKQAHGITLLLEAAIRDGAGYPGTNLARMALKAGGDIAQDEHYFNAELFQLSEFKNLYNYLGGRVFKKFCEHMMKVPRSAFFVLDPKNPIRIVDFSAIVGEVMPLVTILGKYVVNSEQIFESAHELEEANKRDPSITTEDIKVPGSKVGFQVFPHQLKAHQSLRRHPRYAVLDVSPGGGKTITLLTDAAALIGKGLIKTPPCILVPNGLIPNWIEDMHKVTMGRWNLIPITKDSYRLWTDERLTKMIKGAPRNTIIVFSTSALKLDPYPIVIGNHVEQVSGVLEFARKFGFEYVALDESHLAKNASTVVHNAVKQLMVASTVKFVRICTGTLIKDKLTDIVGQTALFNAQVFRTAAEFESENSSQLGEHAVMAWNKDVPRLAREQLSKQCAVISAKRKEWAFMLPRPIESIVPVRLTKSDAEGGAAHQLMYDAVLKKTLEEIMKDKDIKKLLKGESADEGEDDENSSDLPTDDMEDLDDDILQELESKLEPYLQRLEMLLTDPMGDPFGEVYFQGIDRSNYVSNKTLKVIERIKMNFTDYPWQKGGHYKLKDLADYNGKRYTLMGKPGEKLTLESYEEEYESHTSPDKDPRWKLEPRGKVLVFCKYLRSVKAIYNALPPNLRKVAAMFGGHVGKVKWDNLQSFKNSPYSEDKGVQILIAQEDSIKEGHNMQMASRIIRVESPWSPGDIDQSVARIFRPDPTGKNSRETVYLDWVLCQGTIDVAKFGRLISKMVTKTQFDEAENPLYEKLNDIQLPVIRMSLKVIASVPEVEDISEYIDAYSLMAHIQSAEFEEMRQSGPSTLLDVPTTPMFEGARIIEQVPYVPNLDIPDRHDFGLIRLNEYLQDDEEEEIKKIILDPKLLEGAYVHTELGNGIISGIRLTPLPKGTVLTPEIARSRKITSVIVTLTSGDTYTADPSMIYLATNITEENVKSFSPTTKMATRRDRERAKKIDRARERQGEREGNKLVRQARDVEREKERVRNRRTNTTPAPQRSRRQAQPETEANLRVDLFPVVYNGYLAIEGNPADPESLNLRNYGFKEFGDYAYVLVKDKPSFDALLNFIESKFVLSRTTKSRLYELDNYFMSGRGRKFGVQLAPLSEFKNFYRISHTLAQKDKATGKYELKVYPVVINQTLMLNIDLATNPMFKKYVGKVIPGSRNMKFRTATGLHIKFFARRTELASAVKDMKADGLVITNEAEFRDELENTKTVQSQLK